MYRAHKLSSDSATEVHIESGCGSEREASFGF